MSKFDVYRLGATARLVVDCQADILHNLTTRFVVPLLPVNALDHAIRTLNPVFAIDGDDYVLATQFASNLEVRELGCAVGSLDEHQYVISNALDLLISGV